MLASRKSAIALWTALIVTELNIGIHAALTPMHLDEKFYIGVLFCVGNAVLFLVMLLLMNQRLRTTGWLLGTVASVVEFGGFVASRTVGLPQGYRETWASEPEDLLGLVCLAAEVVFVIAAAYALRTAAADRRVMAATVVPVTTISLQPVDSSARG